MAHNPSSSSTLLTASAVVCKLPAHLTSVQVVTDGTNPATVIVYDSPTAASGNVLCQMLVPGAAGNANIAFNSFLVANQGLYCSISGTGAKAIVGFIIS